MKWNEIKKGTGLNTCVPMDKYLTGQGFTEKSVNYLLNPCEMHNPHQMKDYDSIVSFLKQCIQDEKKIVIVGDYDADGVLSTSCLYLTLDYCGAIVEYIIPHRIKNGYGLSTNLIDKSLELNADVILTCDNGIAALDAVEYAKSKGLEVIVTDHHTPGETLPNANYILHPALGEYPFPYISGAQTAYKLCLGIIEECSPTKSKKIKTKAMKKKEKDLLDYLFQLSSLSIVTDVMPIASAEDELAKVNENRKWLMDGIRSIQTKPNWRIKMMMDSLGINQDNFDEQSIGFYIGPCLNAPGRLDDASDAVEFLTSTSETEAKLALSFIIFMNNERKNVKAEEMKKIHLNDKDVANVIISENIHEGILGILAGSYMNDTGKTTVVMSACEVAGEKAYKGSARGNGEVSLYEILDRISKKTDCLYAFGGHRDAAGLTVLAKNIDEFKTQFLKLIEEESKESTYEKNYVTVNGRKERLDMAEAIKELKPFGNGLPLPIIEMNYNISQVDLYYRASHAKITQYEVETEKGKKVFPKFELWLFGKLNEVKPLCDGRFKKSDNIKQIMLRDGLSLEEAEKIKAETYKRDAKEVRVTYKLEASYTDFQGLGPHYSVIDMQW